MTTPASTNVPQLELNHMTQIREAFEAFRKTNTGHLTGKELAAFAKLDASIGAAQVMQDLSHAQAKPAVRSAKVTESIFSGITTVIPMADVQHIERHELGIKVITKHTTWDCQSDTWANNIWLGSQNGEAEDFMKSWCRYRSELEEDTLMDLQPPAPLVPSAPSMQA